MSLVRLVLRSFAPLILTVEASTIDRRIRTTVSLGNKKLLDGESLYQPNDFDHKFRPLVYPGKEDAAWCKNRSLDHIDVKGKVVLCDIDAIGDIEKGQVVKDAGGAAMIVANNFHSGETIEVDAHVVLASTVGYKKGVEIKKYLNSTYTIRDIAVPQGVSIVVSGQELRFTTLHKKLTYEITFTRDINDKVKDPYGQGHMTWLSGKYTVRTPFSFKFE